MQGAVQGGSRIWLIICMLVQLGALLSNMVLFWFNSLFFVFPRGVSSGVTPKFWQCSHAFFSKHLQSKPEMISERDCYGHWFSNNKKITAM